MCPLTGDDCMKHDCEWYVQLAGKDPQSGAEFSKWGCTVSFLPMLLIENSAQQRSTSAGVESFRNEMVAGNNAMLDIFKNAKRLNGGSNA